MFMVLNDLSMPAMETILRNDFGLSKINSRTIWLMRMKIIHAIAKLNVVQLSGVIQIDETFIREAQKDSRHLNLYWLTRKENHAQTANRQNLELWDRNLQMLLTAIDNDGYCICKVTSLGKT